mgnify:CR=1 FL=1
MRFDNLKNYERNWVVGNFEPSLFKTDSVDIGILYCKKNESGDLHYHLNPNRLKQRKKSKERKKKTVFNSQKKLSHSMNDVLLSKS